MVAPITGPFQTVKGDSINGMGSVYTVVDRWRQKRPYDLPLLFKYRRTVTIAATRRGSSTVIPVMWNAANVGSRNWKAFWYDDPHITGYVDAVTNRARAKFVNDVSSNAAWLANIFEGTQSIQMMANRLTQIGRAFGYMRKGLVYNAAKTLGCLGDPRTHALVKKRTKPRPSAHWSSNTWLEFHFGWEPLVKDIYESADFLSRDFGDLPVVGKASMSDELVLKEDYTVGNSRYINNALHSIKCHAHMKATIRVTNPNLFLCARMGLLNPVSVVWELVPFSFVVDWFANVGQFIEQYSELQGAVLLNPCYSFAFSDTCSSSLEQRYYGAFYDLQIGCTWSKFGERKLTIPDVKLGIRPAKRLSIVRAATAIALLVQLGISK